MLLEDLLLLVAGVGAVFLIGIPFYRLVKAVVPKKRDPLAEARERLEQARLEQEALKLNKETEKLYEHMYDVRLGEQESTERQSTEAKSAEHEAADQESEETKNRRSS
jgi:hypothetical protein